MSEQMKVKIENCDKNVIEIDSASDEPSDREEYTHRLSEFYNKYNPVEVSQTT